MPCAASCTHSGSSRWCALATWTYASSRRYACGRTTSAASRDSRQTARRAFRTSAAYAARGIIGTIPTVGLSRAIARRLPSSETRTETTGGRRGIILVGSLRRRCRREGETDARRVLSRPFVTYLSEGTMEPSRLPRKPQIQIIVESIATSETPLPENLSLVREMPTQAPLVRRDIKSNTTAVVNQLRSASILQVSEEAFRQHARRAWHS